MSDEPPYKPGDVMPDGRVMTAPANGHDGYPVAAGAVWVTLDQADRAAAHGWERVGNSERDGRVQIYR